MAFLECIDHVEVIVRDLDQSIAWYERVLGLEVGRRWDPFPVLIGAGGTMLALHLAKDGVTGDVPARLRYDVVAWRASREGFEAAQKHLEACGVSYRGPVDHDGTWSIYFSDPDGHGIEITTVT